jgi:hypothetical protein
MSNIRPMQLGEILDGTFSIYRRHFALFMRLSLIVVWLPTALWVYVQVRYSGLRGIDLFAAFETHPVVVVLLGLGLLVLLTAASMLLKAGTVRVISDSYLGNEPQLAPALQLGLSRIVPLLVVAISKGLLLALICIVGSIVVGLLVFVGRFAGAAVAGLLGLSGGFALAWFFVYVLCGYGITTQTVVLEDLPSSFDAFGRSWDLTRGARGKVFGTAAVTWLISQFLPSMVIAAISAVIMAAGPALQPVLIVLASLMSIVLAPILPCAMTLLYYDLRVRREAFDLQMLGQQLGIG